MIRPASPADRFTQGFRVASQLLLAVLREIFDESAYARYLQRNRLGDSRAAYASYLRESSHARERRPRCC